jgi:two-component system, OmpR family, sensor histidine kinase SenX3
MLALLVIGGAIVGFVVGWSWASSSRPGPGGTPTVTIDPDPVRYRDVLDLQTTGIVITSAAGTIEYRNPAAQELAGTHVGVLIDAAIARHLAGACRGHRSEEMLDLFGPPRRVVHVVALPLDDGRAAAFVSDISERRRVDQVRTDFVANVSHELRTPIGALRVLAETLVDADDPEVVQRVVRRMQSEADRASRTIDDLLELSHIESSVEREFEQVSLADVVRDAVGRVQELARVNGITISTLEPVDVEGPRSESTVVRGDRRQLASAVGNLVENAVKYSDPGGSVQVRVRSSDGFGEIAVIDEGPGIPRQDLDRIFERFYRVDRARSRTTGGTGLGLSIVRHVAGNHGGTVTVESTEGDSTTFLLRIPLADPNRGGAATTNQENEGVA